jgi:hypothetical protein
MTSRDWPDPDSGAAVSDGLVAHARSALSRGDVLVAYDEAASAVEADPDHLAARYVLALSLARAGLIERARSVATDLVARVDVVLNAPMALREDAAALQARLAKDEALATTGPDRRARLRNAADLYETVADRFGRFYTCINAATLRALAGDRDRAVKLACRARDFVNASRAAEPADDYWREATAAEAALILDDLDEVWRALSLAAAIAGEDYAALAVTRRQLRLVCEAMGTDVLILDALAPPLILHYCGHRIDGPGEIGRFPATL